MWCPICSEYMEFYDGKKPDNFFFGMKDVYACVECWFFIKKEDLEKNKGVNEENVQQK